MQKRGWTVPKLEELDPSKYPLHGVTHMSWKGTGKKKPTRITLRLRDPSRNYTRWRDVDEITSTLLHEMSHLKYGGHGWRFRALWKGLRAEFDSMYGTNISAIPM
jgi:hypothetical protein